MWLAIERGDSATCQALLRGADPEVRYQGWTFLMKAAEMGRGNIVTMLCRELRDLNATNKMGEQQ